MTLEIGRRWCSTDWRPGICADAFEHPEQDRLDRCLCHNCGNSYRMRRQQQSAAAHPIDRGGGHACGGSLRLKAAVFIGGGHLRVQVRQAGYRYDTAKQPTLSGTLMAPKLTASDIARVGEAEGGGGRAGWMRDRYRLRGL